ncbi:unnamed protein product [Fraxinus pennsylvanica]|uniref:Topoisomerase 6 subunit A/Spo11 TOPRIM domain-containing protein n=1 Tax=Fraxinus pennsylvanica TaxID=56036 RepID=A0AAD2AJ17_9LAMI|nr:unnamed protein product [Fraxinus pennsylvanica]
MRLAEERFYNGSHSCDSKGLPDVVSQLFPTKMKSEFKFLVLAPVDSDPYGLNILSVNGCGSKNMSYNSSSFMTPVINWLRIGPSDPDRYKIPMQCGLPMTEKDINTWRNLLEEDFLKKNQGECISTQIDDDIRLLHSLSGAKEPNPKTVSLADVFNFNCKFTDKIRRIKIPLPPVYEKKKKVTEDVTDGKDFICMSARTLEESSESESKSFDAFMKNLDTEPHRTRSARSIAFHSPSDHGPYRVNHPVAA